MSSPEGAPPPPPPEPPSTLPSLAWKPSDSLSGGKRSATNLLDNRQVKKYMERHPNTPYASGLVDSNGPAPPRPRRRPQGTRRRHRSSDELKRHIGTEGTENMPTELTSSNQPGSQGVDPAVLRRLGISSSSYQAMHMQFGLPEEEAERILPALQMEDKEENPAKAQNSSLSRLSTGDLNMFAPLNRLLTSHSSQPASDAGRSLRRPARRLARSQVVLRARPKTQSSSSRRLPRNLRSIKSAAPNRSPERMKKTKVPNGSNSQAELQHAPQREQSLSSYHSPYDLLYRLEAVSQQMTSAVAEMNRHGPMLNRLDKLFGKAFVAQREDDMKPGWLGEESEDVATDVTFSASMPESKTEFRCASERSEARPAGSRAVTFEHMMERVLSRVLLGSDSPYCRTSGDDGEGEARSMLSTAPGRAGTMDRAWMLAQMRELLHPVHQQLDALGTQYESLRSEVKDRTPSVVDSMYMLKDKSEGQGSDDESDANFSGPPRLDGQPKSAVQHRAAPPSSETVSKELVSMRELIVESQRIQDERMEQLADQLDKISEAGSKGSSLGLTSTTSSVVSPMSRPVLWGPDGSQTQLSVEVPQHGEESLAAKLDVLSRRLTDMNRSIIQLQRSTSVALRRQSSTASSLIDSPIQLASPKTLGTGVEWKMDDDSDLDAQGGPPKNVPIGTEHPVTNKPFDILDDCIPSDYSDDAGDDTQDGFRMADVMSPRSIQEDKRSPSPIALGAVLRAWSGLSNVRNNRQDSMGAESILSFVPSRKNSVIPQVDKETLKRWETQYEEDDKLRKLKKRKKHARLRLRRAMYRGMMLNSFRRVRRPDGSSRLLMRTHARAKSKNGFKFNKDVKAGGNKKLKKKTDNNNNANEAELDDSDVTGSPSESMSAYEISRRRRRHRIAKSIAAAQEEAAAARGDEEEDDRRGWHGRSKSAAIPGTLMHQRSTGSLDGDKQHKSARDLHALNVGIGNASDDELSRVDSLTSLESPDSPVLTNHLLLVRPPEIKKTTVRSPIQTVIGILEKDEDEYTLCLPPKHDAMPAPALKVSSMMQYSDQEDRKQEDDTTSHGPSGGVQVAEVCRVSSTENSRSSRSVSLEMYAPFDGDLPPDYIPNTKLASVDDEKLMALRPGGAGGGDDNNPERTGTKVGLLNRGMTAMWVGDTGDDTLDFERNTYVFKPESTFLVYWNLLILVLVLYYAIVTPLEMAFHTFDFFVVEVIFTLVFIADIVVNFRSGFVYKDGMYQGTTEMKPSRICKRYMSGWFWVDLLSSLPFFLLSGASSSNIFTLMRGLKLIRVFKLTRSLNYFVSSVSTFPAFIRLFTLCITLLFLWHWLGCAYWMIAEFEDNPLSEWGPRDVYINAAVGTQYVQALLWGVMVTTGIGRDIDPYTDLETAFTICVMIIGVIMTAFVIGSATTTLTELDTVEAEHRRRMERITNYLVQRGTPRVLLKRILKYYQYMWDAFQSESFQYGTSGQALQNGASDPNAKDDDDDLDQGATFTSIRTDILPNLHHSLATELNLFWHRKLVQRIPMFQGISSECLLELGGRMTSQIYLPDEYVVVLGEIPEQMYFILRGNVEILAPKPEHARQVATLARAATLMNLQNPTSQKGKLDALRMAEAVESFYDTIGYGTSDLVRVKILKNGDSFGKRTLLTAEPRSSTVHCLTYAELLLLQRKHFLDVLRKFPSFAESLQRHIRLPSGYQLSGWSKIAFATRVLKILRLLGNRRINFSQVYRRISLRHVGGFRKSVYEDFIDY